jgi:hypothetical protein
MQISFDSSIKVAGIGLVPWTRLGPEQWLPSYKIASLYGWDTTAQAGVPEVFCVADGGNVPDLARLNTAELLKSYDFQRLLDDKLPGYAIFPYKAVTIPAVLEHRRFLMADREIAKKFENKVEFRCIFAPIIPIPAYDIYDRAALRPDTATYSSILNGRKAIVIQDEQLSGGKGTFIIDSYDAYTYAIDSLARTSQHDRVVVSSLVEQARERSIQSCVTKYGVLAGPLQRQIVRHPLLTSAVAADGNKYCGVQICADDQNSAIHLDAQRIAQEIGGVLRGEGYKGIFGIDFLLDQDDKLYAIEINPRVTGVTPLLSALYRAEEGIPFYLLHLLELGNYDYSIENFAADFSKQGASIILHSLETHAGVIEALPKSGTYRLKNGELEEVSDSILLEDTKPGEWIVQAYVPKASVVKPGGRLLTVQTKGLIIDKITDKLYDDTVEFITVLREHIKISRTET